MKFRTELTLVSIALLAVAGIANAGIERAGTTSANFLSVGSGAGILGMGGATLGWGGDLNSVSWNPAALGSMNGTQVVLSHAAVGDQTSQDWAAVGGKFVPLKSRWALTGLYHGNGSFDGLDASGISTGSFGASSMALGATMARSFAGIATLGLGAKFVTEKLGNVTGTGGTFDAGLMVRTGPFGIGAAAQNVGGRMNYGGAVYPMPSNYGIGASYDHVASGVRVALDLNFPSAYYSDVRTGVEWRWRDRLALRTGYRHEMGGASDDPLTGPTFGMGAGARGMWFDYGYLLGGNGGGQHRLGITFRPGGLLSGDDDAGHYGSTVRPIEPTGPPAPKTTKSAPRQTQTSVVTQRSSEPMNAPKSEPMKATVMEPKAIEPARTTMVTPKTPESSIAPKIEPAKAAVSPAVALPAPKKETPVIISRVEPVAGAATKVPTVAPVRASAPLPQTAISKPASAPASAPVEIESKLTRATAVVEPPKPFVTEAPIAKSAVVTPKPVVSEAPVAKSATPAPVTLEVAPPVAKSAPATIAVTPPSAAPASPTLPRPAKVSVQKGETLYQIAQRWGTSVPAIMMENNMVTDKVRTGQTLKLPQR